MIESEHCIREKKKKVLQNNFHLKNYLSLLLLELKFHEMRDKTEYSYILLSASHLTAGAIY